MRLRTNRYRRLAGVRRVAAGPGYFDFGVANFFHQGAPGWSYFDVVFAFAGRDAVDLTAPFFELVCAFAFFIIAAQPPR